MQLAKIRLATTCVQVRTLVLVLQTCVDFSIVWEKFANDDVTTVLARDLERVRGYKNEINSPRFRSQDASVFIKCICVLIMIFRRRCLMITIIVVCDNLFYIRRRSF